MTDRRGRWGALVVAVFYAVAQRRTTAQSGSPLHNGQSVAIAPAERTHWIVDGTISAGSLAIVGVLGASWNTAFDMP